MNRVLNFLLNFAVCFGRNASARLPIWLITCDIFTITKSVVFFRKVTNNQRISQILLVNNMLYKSCKEQRILED